MDYINCVETPGHLFFQRARETAWYSRRVGADESKQPLVVPRKPTDQLSVYSSPILRFIVESPTNTDNSSSNLRTTTPVSSILSLVHVLENRCKLWDLRRDRTKLKDLVRTSLWQSILSARKRCVIVISVSCIVIEVVMAEPRGSAFKVQ